MLPLLRDDYELDWMRDEPNCCWVRGGTLLEKGRFAFLMDKYWGGLRTFIDQRMEAKRRAPFYYSEVIDIMLRIARSMQSLHKRGILHRDLKASNVLIRRTLYDGEVITSRVVVADFETSVGVLGTGFWRAPEVLLALKTRSFHPKIWTEKVDAYSYAMTCYEVVTGNIPFENLNQSDYDAVISGARPSLPADHKESSLEDLLCRCWHSNPSMRPNFDDIVDTLVDHKDFVFRHIFPEAWAVQGNHIWVDTS